MCRDLGERFASHGQAENDIAALPHPQRLQHSASAGRISIPEHGRIRMWLLEVRYGWSQGRDGWNGTHPRILLAPEAPCSSR